MPELPDVELFKAYFDSNGLSKKIQGVEVRSAQVLGENCSPDFEDVLIGKEFVSSLRRGKHLFAALKDGDWIEFHFGMTGFFKFYQEAEDCSDHPRVIFKFGDQDYLAYDCQRKLGEINLVKDLDSYIKERDLGPDALNQITDEDFHELVSSSRGMIKSMLMDQSKIAGIGNIYSDEILFHAGVHPRVKGTNLSDDQITCLYEMMKKVLSEAIEFEVDPEKMSSEYLLPYRAPGDQCPKCGSKIEKVKVSGRSAYFCPECQGSASDNSRK